MEDEEWKPRFKRSTSNPFLYFNERRDEIMHVDEIGTKNDKRNGNHHVKIRLEQTAIFGNGMNLRGEELDDILI